MREVMIIISVLYGGCVWGAADVSIKTETGWWNKEPSYIPGIMSVVVSGTQMERYSLPAGLSDFTFTTDDGANQKQWHYRGGLCLGSTPNNDDVRRILNYGAPSTSPSPHPGVVYTGGYGYLVQCDDPLNRVRLNFSVGPKPPSTPALSCRLDADTAISMLAPPGHSRRPVSAAVVCTGKGEASAVVRTTSPQSVIVADGVTVVLNGQLDEPTPVQGGSSLPIDLHVDVENNHGVAGGYSVSYVLTVDLT